MATASAVTSLPMPSPGITATRFANEVILAPAYAGPEEQVRPTVSPGGKGQCRPGLFRRPGEQESESHSERQPERPRRGVREPVERLAERWTLRPVDAFDRRGRERIERLIERGIGDVGP